MSTVTIRNPPSAADWTRTTANVQHVEDYVNQAAPMELTAPGGAVRDNLAKLNQQIIDRYGVLNSTGEWAAGTDYDQNDLYVSGVVVYIVLIPHTSSASISIDLAAGRVGVYKGITATDLAAATAAATADAQQAAIEAEAYASAAASAGMYFDTIAAGRAAVADTQTFGVVAGGSDGLLRPTLYRRDSVSTQTALLSQVTGTEHDLLAPIAVRAGGITEQYRSANCWHDQMYENLVNGAFGGPLVDDVIVGKNTNAVATVGLSSGRKSLTFTSNNASAASYEINIPIRNFGGVVGGKYSFSARVAARLGTTAGTLVYVEQRNASRVAIAATGNTLAPPVAGAAVYPPAQTLSVSAQTIVAGCVYVYVRFTVANSTNGMTLTDIMLAAGDVSDYRPADLRRDIEAARAAGAANLFSRANLFRLADYALWANAPVTPTLAYDGVRVNKPATLAGSVINSTLGGVGIRFVNTVAQSTRWTRDIDTIGVTVGSVISAAAIVENVPTTVGSAGAGWVAVTIDQRDAAFALVSGTAVTKFFSSQTQAQLCAFAPMTIVAGCRHIGITVQFNADLMALDLSSITIVQGSIPEIRPDWQNPSTQQMVQIKNRNPRGFAFLGDSRMAQAFADSGARVQNARHFFNQANAHPSMAQRMQILYTGASSGLRSDQYLTSTTVKAAVNSGAAWAVIWGVVNDIAQGVTGDQAWLGGFSGSLGIKNAADYLISQGLNVVLVSEPGATNLTTAAQIGAKNRYNRYIREYCESTGGAYLFDIEAVLLDAATGTPTFKSNYLEDNVHPQNLGGYYAGLAFKDLMLPLVPALPSQGNNAMQVFANGGIDQLTNNLFTVTTGGTNSAGFTGDVPANWALSKSGTVTGSIATVPNADGFGNDVVITCNFTNTTDFVRFSNALTLAQIPFNAIVEGGFEVEVDAGSSNFAGCYLLMESTADAAGTPVNLNVQSMYPLNSGPGPVEAIRQIQKTPRLAIGGTATLDNATFRIQIAPQNVTGGASSAQVASCTVRIRRPFYRLRNS